MNHDWEGQFNPRKAVPDFERYVVASKAKSDQAHQRFTDIEELRYGSTPLSNFNYRRASRSGQPLFVFIHGGYWRSRDKNDFGYLFTAMEGSDVNVAILNYDLCPAVTVAQIAEQMRQAIIWLHANAKTLGFDPERIFMAGQSAGAHLIAMILAQPPARFGLPDGMVRKAYLSSGIYELSPVLKITVNDEVRLKEGDVHPLSPIHFPPSLKTPYDIVVGGAEPERWIAQSVEFARHVSDSGGQARFTIMPGRNHFSIMHDLETPDGVLAAKIIADMKAA